MKYLTPTAVAKMRGCALYSVQRAIADGRLKAIDLIGPNGSTSGYGIEKSDAENWNPWPKKKGREKK